MTAVSPATYRDPGRRGATSPRGMTRGITATHPTGGRARRSQIGLRAGELTLRSLREDAA